MGGVVEVKEIDLLEDLWLVGDRFLVLFLLFECFLNFFKSLKSYKKVKNFKMSRIEGLLDHKTHLEHHCSLRLLYNLVFDLTLKFESATLLSIESPTCPFRLDPTSEVDFLSLRTSISMVQFFP